MERRQRADCTVSALAHVACIPYEVAFGIAAEAGRKSSCGASSERVIVKAKAAGIRLTKLRFTNKTLAKFVRLHPEGRFYVRKRGHAVSVIDGVVGDATRLGSIVLDVWQYHPATAEAR